MPCIVRFRTGSGRAGAVTIFFEGLLGDLVLQHRLGQKNLQPSVIGLQFLQTQRLGHGNVTKVRVPQVVTGLLEAVLAA